MTSITKQNSQNEYRATADAIHEVVHDLLNQNVNPGCIASCLIMHATKLSFATCDDPTLIFKNMLGSMLDSIPKEKLNEFDSDLDSLITHPIPQLLN